ncbi:MAG: metallophosphoesterase [Legionellaceae bacterium]|nr:metallophosphoesterase [Legionellaceae bacterium]
MTVVRKNIIHLCLYIGLLLLSFTVNSFIFAATPHTEHFLSTTDIHFDPFLSCQNLRPCPLIENLRHAPSNQWKAILEQQDTNAPIYKKDTNFMLLESALSAFKKAAASQHPRFVLVLGDLLAHDYQENFAQYSHNKTFRAYRAFVKKSMEFLASELEEAFPAIDIYYVVGNHDTYHNAYSSYPNRLFYKDMDKIWTKLIKDKQRREEMQQTFPSAGYYAIDLPQQPNLRLIVLNSVLFSSDAEGLYVTHAARKELHWLHEELNAAHTTQKHVIIALHIPVGIDISSSLQSHPFNIIELWKTEYTSRFLARLEEYAADISVILPGHLHMDRLQVYSAANGHSIPIIGTPSISPIIGNNPAFKVFRYNTQSLQIENFSTYTLAFETNQWRKEYNFNASYQPNCKNCEIINGINAIEPTGNIAERYIHFYATDALSPVMQQLWIPYLWCEIHAITAQDYQACLTSPIPEGNFS